MYQMRVFHRSYSQRTNYLFRQEIIRQYPPNCTATSSMHFICRLLATGCWPIGIRLLGCKTTVNKQLIGYHTYVNIPRTKHPILEYNFLCVKNYIEELKKHQIFTVMHREFGLIRNKLDWPLVHTRIGIQFQDFEYFG